QTPRPCLPISSRSDRSRRSRSRRGNKHRHRGRSWKLRQPFAGDLDDVSNHLMGPVVGVGGLNPDLRIKSAAVKGRSIERGRQGLNLFRPPYQSRFGMPQHAVLQRVSSISQNAITVAALGNRLFPTVVLLFLHNPVVEKLGMKSAEKPIER